MSVKPFCHKVNQFNSQYIIEWNIRRIQVQAFLMFNFFIMKHQCVSRSITSESRILLVPASKPNSRCLSYFQFFLSVMEGVPAGHLNSKIGFIRKRADVSLVTQNVILYFSTIIATIYRFFM